MDQSPGKTILVIDDDAGILTAMQYMLQDAGYSVIPSSNTSIINELEGKNISLILCDLLLSGKNGKDIVKEIKDKDSTKNIPVVMLSAHPAAKDEAKEAGADDFLEKPFNIDDLINIIKKYIGE